MLERIQARVRAVDEALARHASYRIARNSILGLNRRDGQRKAAAMTYFAVFSIFPFILALIAFLSFAIDSEQAQAQIISALSGFFPSGATEVEQVIQGVVAARGVAAGFGILLLLWSTIAWFEAIDRGINEMWAVTASRHFVKGKLFGLAMILGIAVVMALTWAINIFIRVVKGAAGGSGLGVLGGSSGLWYVAAAGISFLLMGLVFLLLYRFSPMCDVAWGEVSRPALITAFIWEVARSGFAVYVTQFANFSSAYGPIGAVIAFLFWLYLAHTIMLLGAVVAYAMRLEAHGIGEMQDLPCALPEQAPTQEGMRSPGEKRAT